MTIVVQKTKDENLISVVKNIDPKINAYKFLTNQYTKNPHKYDKYTKDQQLREVNNEVVKLSFEEYLKRYNYNINLVTEKELRRLKMDFKIKFINGEFVQNPLQYINI